MHVLDVGTWRSPAPCAHQQWCANTGGTGWRCRGEGGLVVVVVIAVEMEEGDLGRLRFLRFLSCNFYFLVILVLGLKWIVFVLR